MTDTPSSPEPVESAPSDTPLPSAPVNVQPSVEEQENLPDDHPDKIWINPPEDPDFDGLAAQEQAEGIPDPDAEGLIPIVDVERDINAES